MKLGTGGLYQPIQSYIVQAGFIHVICLGISNKSVAVPRQDSIRPYRAHAVLSGHCNIYVLLRVKVHVTQGLSLRSIISFPNFNVVPISNIKITVKISNYCCTIVCIWQLRYEQDGGPHREARWRAGCL